jgi:prepilin-type N-terminal cleavage/methylation domain-containing protein
MTRPRGYTLIEMMMVLFILSTLLVLGTTLIEKLLTLDDASKVQIEAMETASRLALMFRDDVRAAIRIDDREAPGRIVLTEPGDRRVEYAISEKTLARIVHEGQSVRQAEPIRLPSRLNRMEVRREEGRTVVAIVFDRRTNTVRGVPSPLRIEATLGSDHRFDEGVRP